MPTRERILNFDDRRVVVLEDVPGLGKVELKDVSARLTNQVTKAARESETPGKTYAEGLAEHVIREPSLTPEQVAELPAATWAVLAPGLADATNIGQWFADLSDEADPQLRLYRADQERWAQWEREMRVAAMPMLQTFASAMQTAMPAIQTAAAFAASDAVSQIIATAKAVQDSGVLSMVNRLSADMARVSFPVADIALLGSGINSPLIHTPSYIVPRALPAARPSPLPRTGDPGRERMLNAYDVLVRLEQAMRRFISERLQAHAGTGWWKQRVPAAINTNCRLSQAKAGGEGRPLIEYAYVGDYRDIILRADNWREVFAPVFGSKVQLEACFEWCTEARVEIAHSRPLPNDLLTAFLLGARRLIAAIERTPPDQAAPVD